MDGYDLLRLSDAELAGIAGEQLTPRQREERAEYLAAVAAEIQRREQRRQSRMAAIRAPVDAYTDAMGVAATVPKPGPRTWGEWAMSSGRPKAPEVAQADRQRAAFVQTLGEPPTLPPLYEDATEEERQAHQQTADFLERVQGLAAMARSNNNPRALAALRDRSEREMINPDQPLGTAFNYMGAQSAAAYNLALAAQGDPDAVKDYRAAAAVLAGPLAEHSAELGHLIYDDKPLVSYQPGVTDLLPFVGTDGYGKWLKSQPDSILEREADLGSTNWRRMKAAREAQNRYRQDWQQPWSQAAGQVMSEGYAERAEPMPGSTFWTKQGMSPAAAYWAGLASDTLTDPLASGFKVPGQIAKSMKAVDSKAKRDALLKALQYTAEDVGPPAAVVGAAAATGMLSDKGIMADPVVRYLFGE